MKTKDQKRNEIHELITTLRRNYPDWPSTFGPCSNDCGRNARGSGLCAYCCEDRLAQLTSKELASELHKHILGQRMCIDEMIECF